MNRTGPPQTPRQRYEADLRKPGFVRDTAQAHAVAALDLLYQRLLSQPALPWWRRLLGSAPTSHKGLYLWGGVGRGKSRLMDDFFECLPFSEKRRLHFHRFMQQVHASLKRLGEQQDPLRIVAREFSSQARVLCFDEFFVSDIADAMLLGRLLGYLFEDRVTLVATSNVAPDDLYRDGLQRERFLPAIKALKQHTHVMNVDGGTDYRLRHLEQTNLFYTPAGAAADAHLTAFFARLTGDAPADTASLVVNQRPIPVRQCVDGVAWFDFDALCDGPRGTEDYIELARGFHTVLVSGIPRFNPEREDQARRFIALVDEFYDRRVKFAASAAAAPDALYAGRRLDFEFRRTASRLAEMQTRDYLALPHLP
ncbi:MAG TPA: cell division protein ZapE [Gammaproteobacteria bacterium]|nr:cell division protein ZapE [Gammaproteobacteria bacterium]